MAYKITRSEDNTAAAIFRSGYQLALPDSMAVGEEIPVYYGKNLGVAFEAKIVEQLSSTLTQATLCSDGRDYLLVLAVGSGKIAGITEVVGDGDPGDDDDPGTWEAEEDGGPDG